MSSQRLSKLQKWILTAALTNELQVPSRIWIYEGFWGKEKVWVRYGDRFDMKGNWRGYRFNYIGYTFRASVSRSLRGLRIKGFIQKGCAWFLHGLWLTDQGKAMALRLTPMDVNNKVGQLSPTEKMDCRRHE